MKNNRKYFIRYFLTSAIIITLFSLVVMIISAGVLKKQQMITIKLNQNQKVFSEKYVLEFSLDEAVLDLLTISKSHYFNEHFISSAREPENQSNQFQNLIESILQLKPNYTQLRYLDTLGMEVFRVNQKNGNMSFSSHQDLQNKASRYYFREGIKLNQGEVYISPFDLNLENGKIEKPYRPMIRICIPVFNPAGEKTGLDVLNYDGTALLNRYREASHNTLGSDYLINKDGYFLSAPDSAMMWGFMFQNETDNHLKKQFPRDFASIDSLSEGQFESPRGLFTVSKVYPIASLDDKEFNDYFPHGYFWKTVSFIPHHELSFSALTPLNKLSLLFAFMLILGLIAAYFYASIASRKKEVQNELLDSEQNLRIANQTKDRFFSILSHDLKNASGAIYYYLDFLMNEYNSFTEDEKKSHLKDVTFAASQQNKLLHEILDWARLQQGSSEFNPTPVSVKELFDEQIALVELSLKNKGLRIELDMEEDSIVFADHDMLKTILRNLINNAIKYSYRDNRIILFARRKAEQVELKVIDFGSGMREIDAEKIFDLASKIQQNGTENEPGTGFGLKLVAELVKKNNGSIKVESKLKEGSSFILSFPSGQ